NNVSWECFDAHGAQNVVWQNNLVVGCSGTTNTVAMVGMHAIDGSIRTLGAVQVLNNIVDAGYADATNVNSAIELCNNPPSECGTNVGILPGNVISGNAIRLGSSAGARIIASPAVTVTGNTGGPNPESVSSINFNGSSSASFAASQPNAVVATLSVNM